MSKVNSIDFEKVEIYKLEKFFDIESFQCGNPIYEYYIKDAISGYLASLKKHNEPIPSIEEELVEVSA